MRSGRKPELKETENTKQAASDAKAKETKLSSVLNYVRRRPWAGVAANQALPQERKEALDASQQVKDGMALLKMISEDLTALSPLAGKDKIDPIMQHVKRLQQNFVKAHKLQHADFNEQLIKEIQVIQLLLAKPLFPGDEIVRTRISNEHLKKLENHLVCNTQFDDKRVQLAKKVTKKEDGANVGCNITNIHGITFTVKQGKTVGNTLSEVFSSMVLQDIVQTSGPEDKSKTLIANAFLVVKQPEKKDSNLPIEKRCENNLFAASEWASGKSFAACNLFGLKKRKKMAGTRQAKDFEDLRKLNAACNLGLEDIVTPAALIADFDLHTENFMLKINDENATDRGKTQIKGAIEYLERLLEKPSNISREQRLQYIIMVINKLKEYGAVVYFHKIDHDSGFYRYADPERKIDFSSHREAPPIHLVEGKFFPQLITQPTSHIVEITGGTIEGLEQLLLSNQGIDRLLKITIESEIQIIHKTTVDFFGLIQDKANVLGTNAEERQAAEFYLLNEFYYHITEKRRPTPSPLTHIEIAQLQEEIIHQLEKGTQLKVEDLHLQLYKCLIKKQSEDGLAPGQRDTYAQQIGNLTEQAESKGLTPQRREKLTQQIEELTLILKKDALIKQLKSLPYIEKAMRAERALRFR